MMPISKSDAGRFCWLDLAATDADSAKAFYGNLFGWTSYEQPANGGSYIRLRLSDQDVGSIYQLRNAHLDHGMPSHWTPYIRVNDVNETSRRAASFGGTVVIRPFVVTDVDRIALILDSVGALVGLWQPLDAKTKANGHA